VCFRWTVFQHDFIKMDYVWNIIVFFVFNRDISFSWSMKSGNLQACLMGEFLVLTVLVHLCLRRNWLSRYVIVLLFDYIIIVVVVMIVLVLFMTLLNFVVFILLFVIFIVCMSINRTPTCSLFINKKSTCSLFIHKMYMKSCFFSLNSISCIECIVFSYICLLRIFLNNTLL
jgi:hypothetical protein